MAWENKIPSVKLVLGRNLFNKLLGVLEFNENLKIEDEDFSAVAQKIKNKILTYSVPREKNEDGIEYVDIRFYTKEASDLIWQLLSMVDRHNEDIDYYSILIKNKEEQKKNK